MKPATFEELVAPRPRLARAPRDVTAYKPPPCVVCDGPGILEPFGERVCVCGPCFDACWEGEGLALYELEKRYGADVDPLPLRREAFMGWVARRQEEMKRVAS